MQPATAAQIVSPQAARLPASTDPVVIVGAGPVGMRALGLLRRLAPERPCVIFGDEPHEPYNRIQLSGLLAGSCRVEDLSLAAELAGGGELPPGVFTRTRVVSIDRDNRAVVDASGARTSYSALVLATGSRPFVPALAGVQLDGVYTFRNMADAERLAARRVQSKHTVVLGAGLLGVEAARAMQRHNTRVTLVDHNPHPMYRQLDAVAGRLLADELDGRGIKLSLGTSLRMIVGTRSVEGVVLRDGSRIPCDTVILSTGIQPNLDLARGAGLAFGRGITVNGSMQTTDPAIYAVGECCEFENQVYGIVAPGFQQAAIAVRTLLGDSTSTFRKPQLATSLKVAGLSVFSLGDPQPHSGARSFTYASGGIYRRITLVGGRIEGINAIGDWQELPLLRDLAEQRRWVSPLQLWRFRQSGDVCAAAGAGVVTRWPDSAVVCNCNSVCVGDLRAAIEVGAATSAALTARTRAGSTCGSCRPLLQELLGDAAPREKETGSGALVVASLAAGLLALGAFAFSLDYPASVQLDWRWDELWRDRTFKQVSGFTLLGLVAASLLFSLRKRVRRFSVGEFAWWRLSHIVLTVSALGALAVHTGFRLGSNLNLALMVTFVGLALVGAVLGAGIALEHRLRPALARRLRAAGLWGHLLVAWPLPALLGVHILKTYYF